MNITENNCEIKLLYWNTQSIQAAKVKKKKEGSLIFT